MKKILLILSFIVFVSLSSFISAYTIYNLTFETTSAPFFTAASNINYNISSQCVYDGSYGLNVSSEYVNSLIGLNFLNTSDTIVTFDFWVMDYVNMTNSPYFRTAIDNNSGADEIAIKKATNGGNNLTMYVTGESTGYHQIGSDQNYKTFNWNHIIIELNISKSWYQVWTGSYNSTNTSFGTFDKRVGSTNLFAVGFGNMAGGFCLDNLEVWTGNYSQRNSAFIETMNGTLFNSNTTSFTNQTKYLESANFSINFESDLNVSLVTFSWNGSEGGALINDTALSCGNTSCSMNITKTINFTRGNPICWRWYSNNSNENNQTDLWCENVGNSLPTINDAFINVTSIQPSNSLINITCNTSDIDIDTLTVYYLWYNDTGIVSRDNSTLDNVSFSNNENITGSCRVYDGSYNSSWFNTSTKMVGDTSAPIISSITSSVTTSSFTLTWTSSEGSNYTLIYDTDGTWGALIRIANATYDNSHSKTIAGLAASTIYYYNISSCDSSDNCVMNGTFTVTTSSLSVPPGGGGGGGAPPTTIITTNVTGESVLDFGIVEKRILLLSTPITEHIELPFKNIGNKAIVDAKLNVTSGLLKNINTCIYDLMDKKCIKEKIDVDIGETKILVIDGNFPLGTGYLEGQVQLKYKENNNDKVASLDVIVERVPAYQLQLAIARKFGLSEMAALILLVIMSLVVIIGGSYVVVTYGI